MGLGKDIRRNWHRAKYDLQRLYQKVTTGSWPPQIIFIHVPKAAGSSVQAYFSTFIGSSRKGKAVCFDSIYEDALPETLQKAKKARYVGGHIDWKTFETIGHPDTFLFTILREPVDRFLSAYTYFQRFPKHFKGYELAKHIIGMPFEEFCTTDDRIVRGFTDNILSRQFSGDLKQFPERESDLFAMTETAISHLSRFNHIGFQHQLEDDMRILSQKANLPAPIKIPRKNVTKDLPKIFPSSPSLTRDDVLKLAAPRLQGDLKIYEAALVLREINR